MGNATRALLRYTLAHILVLLCSAGHTSIRGPSNPDERVILRLGTNAVSPESTILEAAKIHFPEEKALSDVKKVVKSKLKTLPGQCSSLLGPICQLGNVDVGDFPYNQPRVLPKLPGYKDTLPNNEQQGKVFYKRDGQDMFFISIQDGDAGFGSSLDYDQLLHFTTKEDNIEETSRLERLGQMLNSVQKEDENKTAAIMFYATNCPHCHHLADVFRKVAKEYSNRTPFIAVNCNDMYGAEICRKFNVRGLPDVRIVWLKNETYSYVLWEVEDFRQARLKIEEKWHSEKEKDFDQMTAFGWNYQSLKQFVEIESNRSTTKQEGQAIDMNGEGSDRKGEIADSLWPECNATAIDPKWFLGKKSIPSSVTKKVLFINWRSGSVKYFWVDFDGREKFYFEIPPGGQKISSSFVNHIWIAKDADSDKTLATWKITSRTTLFAVHPADDDDL